MTYSVKEKNKDAEIRHTHVVHKVNKGVSRSFKAIPSSYDYDALRRFIPLKFLSLADLPIPAKANFTATRKKMESNLNDLI